MTIRMRSIWTIGHSTRERTLFEGLLTENGIQILADVRRFPGSRKHPQFGQDTLRESLADIGIEYVHFPELGGRRKPRSGSQNTAWRNESFRGYADYMETPAFAAALAHLQSVADETRTAIMCAELLWWRCHRALVSDALQAGGRPVAHIGPEGELIAHPYTAAARVDGNRVRYDE